jgi:hypothetical protein
MQSLAPAVPNVNQASKWYVSTGSVPFTFGAHDAENGLGCCPEMYWSHIDDMRDYCAGFAAVAGDNMTTRYFLGGVN